MAMNFEGMDETTRWYRVSEFEAEMEGGNPYLSRALSPKGRTAFCSLMRIALLSGNEESLAAALQNPNYWNPTETHERNGVVRERQVNVRQAVERLSLTEFNTWYVRGFAKRLIDEGVAHCQAYRAAQPKGEPAGCSAHEGQVFTVAEIYNGHRAKYWPVANPSAVSIPFGPGCHHTIRRVR
jgi:hypothetical protein